MFSRRLNSVVDMRPRYMAQFDGSEQATGRGSGLEERRVVQDDQQDQDQAESRRPRGEDRRPAGSAGNRANSNVPDEAMTPYMQMTYAPQERRLDLAVFRALFASSARQARQMVVHGAVKVNGVKVRWLAIDE
jgi:ribosomal protein S4